jgi:hypothetical protein
MKSSCPWEDRSKECEAAAKECAQKAQKVPIAVDTSCMLIAAPVDGAARELLVDEFTATTVAAVVVAAPGERECKIAAEEPREVGKPV